MMGLFLRENTPDELLYFRARLKEHRPAVKPSAPPACPNLDYTGGVITLDRVVPKSILGARVGVNMKTRVLLLTGIVAAIAAGRAVADEPAIISRVALLSATTNAPPGATGLATFYPGIWATPNNVLLPPTNAPLLHVTTEGLSTGTYTVVVTDTDTNSYTLGNFGVATVTNGPPITTPGGRSRYGYGSLTSAAVTSPCRRDWIRLTWLAFLFPTPTIWWISPGRSKSHLPHRLAGCWRMQRWRPPQMLRRVATGIAQLLSGPCFEPLDSEMQTPIIFGPTIRVTTDGLLGGIYTVSITDVATNTYVLGLSIS